MKSGDGDRVPEQIDLITNALLRYRPTLQAFAYEIDSSSHDASQEIRVTADNLIGNKAEDLRLAKTHWMGHTQALQTKAINDVREALKCSNEIAVAASCLQNTVENGRRDPRPVCSDEALRTSAKCVFEEPDR
jgi:hypothetical protein